MWKIPMGRDWPVSVGEFKVEAWQGTEIKKSWPSPAGFTAKWQVTMSTSMAGSMPPSPRPPKPTMSNLLGDWMRRDENG